MNTSPHLERCPFCGGRPRLYTIAEEHPSSPCTFYVVRCSKCEANIETESMVDSVSRWNRRI